MLASESGCVFAGEDADLHNYSWHGYFSSFLRRSLECFDMPVLPQLSSTSLQLCHVLDQGYSEERSFGQFDHAMVDSDWVKSNQDGRRLRLSTAVIVAMATFLRSEGVDLYGCHGCRVICLESFSRTPSTVGFEVANTSEREGLGPPLVSIRGTDNTLGEGRSAPPRGFSNVHIEQPAGVEASTSMLRKPTLSNDEVRSQVVAGLLKLKQCLDSIGLDASECFQCSDGGDRACLKESTLPRRLPSHDASRPEKSKSNKVEEIKDKLLEMLRELNLPYERLPWYTLDKDLEKRGYALVNWPAAVLRKRGNRGIHDLSAVEVNTLYEAITRPDETRLRICRHPSALTVVPVKPVNHTPVAALGSKRPVEEPDAPGHPSKRIRFRDMTSKVLRQHPSDHGASGP
ncbi:hypothetical protein EDD16DRAFT_1540667 [Pisolithus croceorrhizus]|nr:hypothetical protein EDD16DRAFT_1540667 [Pisolithus croceorrhizus]